MQFKLVLMVLQQEQKMMVNILINILIGMFQQGNMVMMPMINECMDHRPRVGVLTAQAGQREGQQRPTARLALQQPASAMRAAGTQKMRVVGYNRGGRVLLASL